MIDNPQPPISMHQSVFLQEDLGIIKIELPGMEPRPNGMLLLGLNGLPLSSDFSQQFLISIPPGQMGGNHKHLHREAFFSFDEHLELHWVDGNGRKHMSKMREGNRLFLFVVPSGIPHAVINRSDSLPALLLEYRDGERRGVEPYQVIERDF